MKIINTIFFPFLVADKILSECYILISKRQPLTSATLDVYLEELIFYKHIVELYILVPTISFSTQMYVYLFS